MSNTVRKDTTFMRIENSKYEFKNIIRNTNYNNYNSNTFDDIITNLNNISFNVDKMNEIRNLVIEVISDIDNIPEPNKSNWENIKNNILDSKALINEEDESHTPCKLSIAAIRIWNGLLTMQYFIEEDTMPKNVNLN